MPAPTAADLVKRAIDKTDAQRVLERARDLARRTAAEVPGLVTTEAIAATVDDLEAEARKAEAEGLWDRALTYSLAAEAVRKHLP